MKNTNNKTNNKTNNNIMTYKTRPSLFINIDNTFILYTSTDNYIMLNSKSKDGRLIYMLRYNYYHYIMKKSSLLLKINIKFNRLPKCNRAHILTMFKIPNLNRWNRLRSQIRKHL